MKYRAVVAARVAAGMLIGLTAVGCGSPPEAPPAALGPPVAPPSGAAAAPLAESVLRARLLTEADLPAGFGALATPADIGLPPATAPDKTATNPAACVKVLAPVSEQQPGAHGSALARFGGPSFGSIDIDAASYPAGDAAKAFSGLQLLLRQCGKYRGKDADGAAVSYEIQPHPPLRDNAAAATFALRTTSDGLTITSIVALVTDGSTVCQLAISGPREPDHGALERLARVQLERLTAK